MSNEAKGLVEDFKSTMDELNSEAAQMRDRLRKHKEGIKDSLHKGNAVIDDLASVDQQMNALMAGLTNNPPPETESTLVKPPTPEELVGKMVGPDRGRDETG